MAMSTYVVIRQSDVERAMGIRFATRGAAETAVLNTLRDGAARRVLAASKAAPSWEIDEGGWAIAAPVELENVGAIPLGKSDLEKAAKQSFPTPKDAAKAIIKALTTLAEAREERERKIEEDVKAHLRENPAATASRKPDIAARAQFVLACMGGGRRKEKL